jgi:hypothetical protein
MTRRKSVQQLVNPLRKLSLLSSSPSLCSFQPDLDFVPEQHSTQQPTEHTQEDILSLFPREIILKILSLLSFHDLTKVQLTCKIWNRLAQDISIWRNRYVDLNTRFTDIYAHDPTKLVIEVCWKTRYCQAITFANWRMGTVAKLSKIGAGEAAQQNNGEEAPARILSVKLRDQLLVTLAEVGHRLLYQYF